MDLKKIVRDRMTELDMNARQLAAAADVPYTTLIDFTRDPKDFKSYDEAKTRKGNLNSDAMGRVLVALDLIVVVKPGVKKAKK